LITPISIDIARPSTAVILAAIVLDRTLLGPAMMPVSPAQHGCVEVGPLRADIEKS